MKKLMTLAIAFIISVGAFAQNNEVWSSLKKDANFFLANDLGRNGYYDQKPIAELMGIMAEEIGPECIIAAGDVHHFDLHLVRLASVCKKQQNFLKLGVDFVFQTRYNVCLYGKLEEGGAIHAQH